MEEIKKVVVGILSYLTIFKHKTHGVFCLVAVVTTIKFAMLVLYPLIIVKSFQLVLRIKSH